VCTIRIKNKKTKKKETSGPIKVPSPPFAYFQTQKHLLNNMEKELVAIIFSSSRMQLGIKETGQMKMSTFGRRSGVYFSLFILFHFRNISWRLLLFLLYFLLTYSSLIAI
jgi:hypothetical protein